MPATRRLCNPAQVRDSEEDFLTGWRARGLLWLAVVLVLSAMRGGLCGALGLLIAANAHADPLMGDAHESGCERERLKVRWVGSRDCRPTREVVEGLHRLFGGNPHELLPEVITVDARIESLQQGWSLALSTRVSHDRFERKISAPTCSEIAQAAALVLSVWFQPRVPSPVVALSSDATRLPEPATAVEIEPAPIARRSRARNVGKVRLRYGTVHPSVMRRIRLHLSFGGTMFYGPLPQPGLGVMGRVGASLSDWQLDALLLWLSAQEVKSPISRRLSGQFNLTGSGMRIARVLSFSRELNIQPGIWATIGWLHGEGKGELEISTPSNGGWGAAGLGIDAIVTIGHFTAAFGGAGGLPFGRPRFWLGTNQIYQTPAIAGCAHLLFGVTFL